MLLKWRKREQYDNLFYSKPTQRKDVVPSVTGTHEINNNNEQTNLTEQFHLCGKHAFQFLL